MKRTLIALLVAVVLVGGVVAYAQMGPQPHGPNLPGPPGINLPPPPPPVMLVHEGFIFVLRGDQLIKVNPAGQMDIVAVKMLPMPKPPQPPQPPSGG